MVVVEALMVSALVSTLTANAGTLLNRELGLAWDAKLELRKLVSTLSTIETMLQASEEMPSHNREMQQWLRKLQDAVDEATILLDSFFLKKGQLFPLSSKFPYINGPAHDIKDIKEIIEALGKEKGFLSDARGNNVTVAVQEATDPSLPHSEVHERVAEKEVIVELLRDTSCQEKISVIPIVGIPGIGKTTLAKMAFNDNRVTEEFRNGLMIWVWVSDGIDVKKIAQDILQSAASQNRVVKSYWNWLRTHLQQILPGRKSLEPTASQNHVDNPNWDQTKTRLQQILQGKKFLLVLDNVWNDSGKNWDELKHILEEGEHGSKVIVTTRNNKVANIMKTTNPYHLEGLKESSCWSIFAQTAFKGRQNINQFLEEIGWKIAGKSKGVPLAAEALGRLMHQKDEAEWLSVKNSEIWNLAEENEILNTLRMSYKHLPKHAYRCLAYCSVFPRDYEIDRDIIIKLWIAHDFIQPKGSKEVEDIGHDTFQHLLDRFFFQPLRKDEEGRTTTFKLHALIYDLARCEMEISINRHFFSYGSVSDVPKNVYLRTLCLLNCPQRSAPEVQGPIYNKFRLLRALDLSNSAVTFLPDSVGGIMHLRYINLSGTDIESLPAALSGLENLQSLILKRCLKLRKLPPKMRKMKSLRHLDVDECESLDHMPNRIGQLQFLQTLPIFIVGKEKGYNMRQLGALNLRGKLDIRYLGNVENGSEAGDANLKEKEHLNTLSLSWKAGNCRNLPGSDKVFDALQPHKYLKRLSVQEYKGKSFASWLNSYCLPNLVELTLINCRGCESLPPLGELPSLKSLTIGGLDAARCFGKAFYGFNTQLAAFPSLEELNCLDMICLESWESEKEDSFPRLSVLIIKRCSKLSNLPRISSRSLRHLEIVDCPNLDSTKATKALKNLHFITSLKIERCDRLMSLPEGLRRLTSP
ncbi:uncharacterized protein A4U43_C08F33280 [Asparagus officinalis]|uniref:disease resistance protein RGA2-like n=1 Tax=Asparagus officinalis TaxID=4686 RepID=UPI00098E6FD8|nr:disease resistance protein RGA2-like [Asparagus officinalis]ONK61759.1 uncharacterized protein A4U43_C08F33280 [Asparagus officinalis]